MSVKGDVVNHQVIMGQRLIIHMGKYSTMLNKL